MMFGALQSGAHALVGMRAWIGAEPQYGVGGSPSGALKTCRCRRPRPSSRLALSVYLTRRLMHLRSLRSFRHGHTAHASCVHACSSFLAHYCPLFLRSSLHGGRNLRIAAASSLFALVCLCAAGPAMRSHRRSGDAPVGLPRLASAARMGIALGLRAPPAMHPLAFGCIPSHVV